MENIRSASFDSVASFIDAMLECNKLSNGNGCQKALAVLQNKEMQKSLVRSKRSCEVISQVANKVVDKEMRVLVEDKSLKFSANQVNLDMLAAFDLKSIA